MLSSFSWQIIRDPAWQLPCLVLLGPAAGQWANVSSGSSAFIPYLSWYQANFPTENHVWPPLRPHIWLERVGSIVSSRGRDNVISSGYVTCLVTGAVSGMGTTRGNGRQWDFAQAAEHCVQVWEITRPVLLQPLCHHVGQPLTNGAKKRNGSWVR